MLLHQCDALARAGGAELLTPAIGRRTSWKPTFITATSIFYDEADALLMLNLDFSDTTDWNRLPDYLT